MTLVFLDVLNGEIVGDALAVISRAAELGGEVAALAFGPGAEQHVDRLARHGASRIFLAGDAIFADPLPGPRALLAGALIERLATDLVLAPTTTMSCDVMAVLAARLEAGLLWGLSGLEQRDGRLVGLRPAQSDAVIAEVEWTGTPRLGLFRPYALSAQEHPVQQPLVEALSPLHADGQAALTLVETAVTENAGPSLAEADIVVAGGRGLGTEASLDMIRELAALLGGAAGVSLPLVEMGWAPRAMQVGQTGTVVRPRLYVACGISGQIQHRVGMERSGTIIAINNDPAAPIMSFCDLGVVGDAGKLLPAISDLIRQRSSETA